MFYDAASPHRCTVRCGNFFPLLIFYKRSTDNQIPTPVADNFLHVATASAVEGSNGRSSKRDKFPNYSNTTSISMHSAV